jgi:hypothetical protein
MHIRSKYSWVSFLCGKDEGQTKLNVFEGNSFQQVLGGKVQERPIWDTHAPKDFNIRK